ncbi:MAG: SRPBCC domain-containing protein, partial [Candidatus Sulfotelmatobacter sp.]
MTNTPSFQITPDHDAVITEIEIAAPPERVFRAIVDPDQELQWGGGDNFEIILWEMDPRPGGN